jgi:hypothetical protein
MSMTKKEQAEVEALKIRLALHFTSDVNPDISRPDSGQGIINGYNFNSYNKRIEKSCSTSYSHGNGQWDKTGSQNAIAQYSSPILAYRAMRRELEDRFARELREVDIKIETENAKVPE